VKQAIIPTAIQRDNTPDLVRQLIEESCRRPAAPGADGKADVILDLEVDGVRCVLSRRPEDEKDGAVLSPREREMPVWWRRAIRTK
jgi:hypothetical protein